MKKTIPAEKKVETEDGKGAAGDLSEYVPRGKDRRIQEVYGEWVHFNNGLHLSWRIENSGMWQKRWQALAVMPARSYDAPIGIVVRRFVHALAEEIT